MIGGIVGGVRIHPLRRTGVDAESVDLARD
jgi:hypothetical protein